MNRRALWLLLLIAAGCGREKTNETPPSGNEPEKAPTSSTAGASAANPASSAQKGDPAAGKAAAPVTELAGAYDAKQGEVRMPSDAPPFIHPEGNDAVGAGQLSLMLPSGDGEVTGIASGALGDQKFSGWLEEGRLTGNLLPVPGATPSMTGIVLAAVEGAGDARVVKGDLRASGADGKVVRVALFTLKKK